MPIARKASRAEALLKCMLWGEAGSRKTRTALSFPAPLIIDLERGSEWYASEFDFWIATPSPELKAGPLVHQVVEEILAGAYPDRKTLIVDPITDYLDALEQALIEGQKKRGIDLDTLKGMKRAQAYAAIRDGIRSRIDQLLRVPMHVVLVARAKNIWGEGSDGKMAPVGRTYDARDIVEYLCDVVMHLGPHGARVCKSRIAALPEVLQQPSYQVLAGALYRPLLAAPAEPSPAAAPVASPAPPASEPIEMTEEVLQEIAAIQPWLQRIQAAEAAGSEEQLDAVRNEMNAALKKRTTKAQGEALRRAIDSARCVIQSRAPAPAAQAPSPEEIEALAEEEARRGGQKESA